MKLINCKKEINVLNLNFSFVLSIRQRVFITILINTVCILNVQVLLYSYCIHEPLLPALLNTLIY
jgi:hypothetical protein